MTKISSLVEDAKEIVSSEIFDEARIASFCDKVDLLLSTKLSKEAEEDLKALISLYQIIIDRALKEKAGIKLKMKELKKRGDGLRAYLRPSHRFERGKKT